MKSLKSFICVSFLIISAPAWSCKISKDNEWFLSDENIIKRTQEILVGRIVSIEEQATFGSKMYNVQVEVDQSLKGKLKKGQKIILGPFYKSKNRMISYNKDCKLIVPLEMNSPLIILKDKFHAKSIQEYRGLEDQWLKKIKSTLNNK